MWGTLVKNQAPCLFRAYKRHRIYTEETAISMYLPIIIIEYQIVIFVNEFGLFIEKIRFVIIIDRISLINLIKESERY